MIGSEGNRFLQIIFQRRSNQLRLVVFKTAVDQSVTDCLKFDIRVVACQPGEQRLQSYIMAGHDSLLIMPFDREDAVAETDSLEFTRKYQCFRWAHIINRELEAGRTAIDRQNVRHISFRSCLRFSGWPLPVPNFRLVNAVLVGVSDVVHDLIFQPLLYVGAASLQARNSIDYVDRQIESVYLVDR